MKDAIQLALQRGGYRYQPKVLVGQRPGGGDYHAGVAQDGQGRRFLVAAREQQTNGTAEQKIPFEVLCLITALEGTPAPAEKAYLVLGGDGWTLRDFYAAGGLHPFIPKAQWVTVLSLEDFLARANQGQL